ncbi:MFS transporter [Aeromonas caviae]|uniref:hypothetical protein n=1 Tax=Aeromonas caviae TaxID=648 RepID=UPI002B4A2061|nr:hypothetical protein [Aeromonas caviae]
MLSTLSSRRPRGERLATRATFFCSGFATAAWASIIPLAKLNAQISDATQGYVGVLSSPALVGFVADAFGLPAALHGVVLLMGLAPRATPLSTTCQELP